MDSFLERFAKDRKVRRDPSTKFAVSHDKWDRLTADQIAEEVKDYKMAERELGKKVDTGYEAMNDTLFSLFKANPHLKDPKQVRPSYAINHRVIDEMMSLKEWDRGRDISIGDPVGAGLAAATMEPHLEALFDKMQEAQKQASELEQMLGEAEDYADKIDDLMDQAQQSNDNDEVKDFNEQAEQLQEQLDALMQQMQDAQDNLNAELDDKQGDMKGALQAGLKELNDQNDAMQQIDSWGMNSGGFRKMNPEARLALTKKLQTEKFRKMSELFGRMQSVALSEQVNRAEYAADEIYDLEQGSDLARVIPPEMLALNDENLVLDWLHRYVENSLIQYSLRGDDTVVKGGIILLEDGSSSMGGTREIWAKAIGLALLKVAIMQKRPFYAVNFAGPGSYMTFDFDTSGSELKLKMGHGSSAREFSGPEAIVAYAEGAMHGGPLRVDQRVITPVGWCEIGTLEVGDQVYGPDGQPTNVIGVYPQGELDLYEVTFKDGAKVVCDGSHIWTVKSRTSGKVSDMTLNMMLDAGLTTNDRYSFSVPMSRPVELPSVDVPMHPYLLGYLLGDGTLGDGRSVSIHSSEEEHPWKDYLPSDVSVTTYSEPSQERCGSYGLSGPTKGRGSSSSIIEALKDLDLYGLRGADKFIPSTYMTGSIEQRFDLLSGLLDSDGSIVRDGGFEFSNTSLALAEGVVELTQSLGGVASLRLKETRENEQACWVVLGRISADLGAPFKLTRKVESYVQHKHPYVRSIVSAVRVDRDEAICIKVDRDDGLFLTEGYVVTHNTDFMTPLSLALDLLRVQHNEKGATEGDIVFLTDGECGVPDSFMKEFKAEQARLEFKVFGVAVQTSPKSEPLATICDGKCIGLKQLTDASDVSELFAAV